MAKISIVLAEDHELVRAGFKYILQTEPDITIVGEVADGLSCLDMIVSKEPDIVLLDISMPKMSGISVIQKLKKTSPKTKILILTAAEDLAVLEGVLVAKTDGIALKSISKEELIRAIKYITSKRYSEVFIHKEILKSHPEILDQKSTKKELSGREKQILKLVATGLRTIEIAAELKISPRTVSKHRENIMNKMQLNTPADMTSYATQSGLTLLSVNEVR